MQEPEQIAKALMSRFPGWMAWHGRATGTWWAYGPYGSDRRLIESPTPEELARRIRTVSGHQPDGSGQAKPPSLQWRLDEDPWPVRAARRQATAALAGWGPQDRLDDVLLVVSELVTNARSHGRPPITLSLTRVPAPEAVEPVLIIEVGDGSTEPSPGATPVTTAASGSPWSQRSPR